MGHNGIFNRKLSAGGEDVNPKLHMNNVIKSSISELLGYMFMYYIITVLLIELDENFSRERVTYVDFLFYLGLWSLTETSFGPLHDDFYDKTCHEFLDTPVQLSKYMSQKCVHPFLSDSFH